jgi:hypothetical protein
MIGGNGTDTTAATLAYLRPSSGPKPNPFLANLFLLGEREDPGAQLLTDWESPLSWSQYGIFNPGVVKRSTVDCKIGFTVNDFSFEWSPKAAPFTNDIATANPYQLARLRFYDGKPFKMFRTIGPTKGDADTFGACVLFSGRVKAATIERGKITFTIESWLNVVNQMVPPNVIEVTNTLAGYKGATPVLVDGETTIPRFTVVAPSSTTTILGVCTSPTPNKIYGDNKFKNGFLYFTSGKLAGLWSAMGGSNNAVFPIIGGGSVQYNRFIVATPFSWDPAPGDQFYVSTAYPVSGPESPFTHVPAPAGAI